jgi:uncharacterized protein DUF2652
MAHDMRPESGFLVLADISGFTAFVTGTELEHGALITGTLLERVMSELSPPLEIQEVEGDAVFALGPDEALGDTTELPGLFADAFTGFKRVQSELAGDESCTCRACRGVPSLDLKLIVHHGRFVRQDVGGRPRVAGPDVILVHRLLKNSLGRDAYLLLTASALDRSGMDPIASGMRSHVVSYPHLGDVQCFVVDLAASATSRSALAAMPAA